MPFLRKLLDHYLWFRTWKLNLLERLRLWFALRAPEFFFSLWFSFFSPPRLRVPKECPWEEPGFLEVDSPDTPLARRALWLWRSTGFEFQLLELLSSPLPKEEKREVVFSGFLVSTPRANPPWKTRVKLHLWFSKGEGEYLWEFPLTRKTTKREPVLFSRVCWPESSRIEPKVKSRRED